MLDLLAPPLVGARAPAPAPSSAVRQPAHPPSPDRRRRRGPTATTRRTARHRAGASHGPTAPPVRRRMRQIWASRRTGATAGDDPLDPSAAPPLGSWPTASPTVAEVSVPILASWLRLAEEEQRRFRDTVGMGVGAGGDDGNVGLPALDVKVTFPQATSASLFPPAGEPSLCLSCNVLPLEEIIRDNNWVNCFAHLFWERRVKGVVLDCSSVCSYLQFWTA
ncbi:hypothetical protein ABZP36_034025 [Zizania latifolia]